MKKGIQISGFEKMRSHCRSIVNVTIWSQLFLSLIAVVWFKIEENDPCDSSTSDFWMQIWALRSFASLHPGKNTG